MYRYKLETDCTHRKMYKVETVKKQILIYDSAILVICTLFFILSIFMFNKLLKDHRKTLKNSKKSTLLKSML